MLNLDFSSGGFEDLDDQGLIVHHDPATTSASRSASTVTAEFVQTGAEDH